MTLRYGNLLLDPGAGGAAGGGGAGAGGAPNPGAGAGAGAAGGGAGGAGRWFDSLPEDIRGNPSIVQVPDVATLAKNYLNAEKLIGQKRLAIPGQNAQPSEWEAVYNALGRPETLDKYGEPTVKPAEGLNLDKAGLQKFREVAHKAGLSDGQFKQIMDFYLGGLNENHKAITTSLEANRTLASENLRKEWGDKFDANLDIAKSTLRHFGSEEVFNELESGLGNHTGIVKMLHTIGTRMLEDRARGGSGTGIVVGTASAATAEIESLKTDKQFMEAFMSDRHVGHAAAVARWMELHRKAYPGQVAGV